MSNNAKPEGRAGVLKGVGPAIITASVVIGPGSILTASQIGHQYEYQVIWILAVTLILMVTMTALSARLGVTLDGTLCDELAQRAGRPLAALTGVSLFLIAACFQFGNNLGVLAAIEPFYPTGKVLPIAIVVALNGVIVYALYGFKSLYQPVERLMKILVGLMIIGFASNLLMARPDVLKILDGLLPRVPAGAAETILPVWKAAVVENGQVVRPAGIADNLLLITAMVATTFSLGGAFYQSYLVRQRGWTRNELRQGFFDSCIGIATVGLITLMIMVTSAAVLHGREVDLNSAAAVAKQLEPAFGATAKFLFCVGIFAGAFSSFLVNAVIGGSVLADGLGLGGYVDQPWPKRFTVLTLAVGMFVAIGVLWSGERPVNLIIFAQALTVLVVPLLAAAMLWLATRADMVGDRQIPLWMKIVGSVGLLVTLFLATRTAMRLLLPVLNS